MREEPAQPRRGPLRRLAGLAVRLAVAVVVGSVLVVLLLRVVAPPASALMILRKVENATAGRPAALRYRWRDLEQISPSLALAVIAAEDQRFPEHAGFDLDAIADAIAEHRNGRRLRGASTITQQVAKNLFLWPSRSYLRKGAEAGFTVLIERVWPKRRTLEVYLNIAEWGELLFGAEAASQYYFGKTAADLSDEEAALLAAVLPNPHRLRADAPSDWVRQRQRWILAQMRQLGGAAYLKFAEP